MMMNKKILMTIIILGALIVTGFSWKDGSNVKSVKIDKYLFNPFEVNNGFGNIDDNNYYEINGVKVSDTVEKFKYVMR